MQFDDTRIVSGSTDNTIKVWNIRTNSPWSVLTLAGHSGTVRCLHLEGNRLVSGSMDCSIKVSLFCKAITVMPRYNAIPYNTMVFVPHIVRTKSALYIADHRVPYLLLSYNHQQHGRQCYHRFTKPK